MSKAFTRESDDLSDEVALVRPRLSGSESNFITREGAKRLQERLNHLLEEKRIFAREEETPNAKAALKRHESEIQKIQSALNSVIIAEPPADQDRIAFGATVRVRDEDGDDETYQIVGVAETDPAQGRISSVSPLARALLRRRAGETVRFQSPGGQREFTILNVRY